VSAVVVVVVVVVVVSVVVAGAVVPGAVVGDVAVEVDVVICAGFCMYPSPTEPLGTNGPPGGAPRVTEPEMGSVGQDTSPFSSLAWQVSVVWSTCGHTVSPPVSPSEAVESMYTLWSWTVGESQDVAPRVSQSM